MWTIFFISIVIFLIGFLSLEIYNNRRLDKIEKFLSKRPLETFHISLKKQLIFYDWNNRITKRHLFAERM